MNSCGNGAMDATTFASMGNNHLVQNNFGARLEGRCSRRQETFLLLTMKGLRGGSLAKADAQTLTVPTVDEIQGKFGMSNAKIYDPTTAVANPNYVPPSPPAQQLSLHAQPISQQPGFLSVESTRSLKLF